MTPHVLRHSFVIAALDNGWEVYTLNQALGHADAETTASTYLYDNKRERNVSLLNAALKQIIDSKIELAQI